MDEQSGESDANSFGPSEHWTFRIAALRNNWPAPSRSAVLRTPSPIRTLNGSDGH